LVITAEDVRDLHVIDTDTHMIESADLWTSRVSVGRWGDLVPHVKWDHEAGEEAWYFGSERVAPAVKSAMAGWHEYPPDHPKKFSEVRPELLEPAARLRLMDEYGIWAQVVYPNVAGFGAGRYLGLKEPELMLQCVRAYNDFLADWGRYAPGRYVPIMALPFWDLDESIKEMERAAAAGHKGIVFGSQPEVYGTPPLVSPHWDRIWDAAQSLELPINFHIASGDNTGAYDIGRLVGRTTVFAVTPVLFFLGNARAISYVIAGGICHRFPKLNFVSVESGVGWLPFAVQAMDWQWTNCNVRAEHPEYDLLPSEYFKRQIYGCSWFEGSTELNAAITQIGDTNILYETDFPHPTSMSPGPATAAMQPDSFIAEAFSDLAPDTRRRILHDNAARIYHLD
jgi:predicted TIM-barrel fold metal-dependent hydrolase